jgi:branched-chain amino acid transport system substrate-binding protein
MGPRYSSDGAVQAVVRAGAKKIAFDQSNVPGTGYIAAGPTAVAKSLNVPITQFKDNVPIQDANSIALKLVQAAGTDGGVVLNFTPPEALKILQAAQQQGLQDRVKAGPAPPRATPTSSPKALGQQWDGKLLVNAELNVTDSDGPQTRLYRAVFDKYGSKVSGGLARSARWASRWRSCSCRRSSRSRATLLAEDGQHGDRGPQGVQDRHPVQPVVLRQAPLHIPNNADCTTTPEQRQDGDQGAVLQHLGADPASPGAQDREGPSLRYGAGTSSP